MAIEDIDPTKPAPGVPASKADLRANLAAIKDALQNIPAGPVGPEGPAGPQGPQGEPGQDGSAAINGVPIDMAGQLLTRPVLKGFAEAVQRPAIVGGVLAFDLEAGNVAEATLTANVASMAILNPPPADLAGTLTVILRQDGTGGRTVAWPTGVAWLGGEPTMPAAPNAVMIAVFLTTDGGATWLGFWR